MKNSVNYTISAHFVKLGIEFLTCLENSYENKKYVWMHKESQSHREFAAGACRALLPSVVT